MDTNIAQLETQWGGSESPNWISERQPSRFLLIENHHCFILCAQKSVSHVMTGYRFNMERIQPNQGFVDFICGVRIDLDFLHLGSKVNLNWPRIVVGDLPRSKVRPNWEDLRVFHGKDRPSKFSAAMNLDAFDHQPCLQIVTIRHTVVNWATEKSN